LHRARIPSKSRHFSALRAVRSPRFVRHQEARLRMRESRSDATAPADPAEARVRAILEEGARVQRALAVTHADAIVRAGDVLAEAFRAGGRALLFGNGGSAADALHIAAEWCGRLGRHRPALPALALPANTAELTAVANDYGFERIFARGIEAHGRPGDVALAISTSGDSPNVLAAVDEARARGLRTLALAGKGGGKLASRVELAIVVPSDDTQRIQEAHIAIGHALAALVEDALFPAR
jgi:D-sedoheptulose 7-phosphate isomerase